MLSLESETSGFVDNWQSRKPITTCNLHMLTSEDSCDVSFKVGATQSLVRAHKYVLISRSCVFHSMLCGDLASEGDIMIPDVEEKIFREMLKYLYTEICIVNELNVIGLLYLSKKYAVGGLEDNCGSFLDKKLNPQNACLIMEQAHVFDEKDLQDKALKIILENGDLCLETDEFKSVCEECFLKMMRSDTLTVKPGIMLNAALTWANHELICQGREVTPENTRHMLGESIYSITFTSMEQEEFAKTVVPSGILTSEEMTKIFCYLNLPNSNVSPFRVRNNEKYHNRALKEFTRVSLYDLNVLLNDSVDQTNIEIVCKTDVSICGFILFGQTTPGDVLYNIEVTTRVPLQNDHFSSLYVDRDFMTFTNVRGQPMKSEFCEVHLPLPREYLMSKGNKHHFCLKFLSKAVTLYCGKNLRSIINFDGCRILLKENSKSRGLISQLILKMP